MLADEPRAHGDGPAADADGAEGSEGTAADADCAGFSEGPGGQATRENGRGGPRHAAPRRPLFPRVHVPAGKAIALAAMPTAVLMGMGLTPRLAMASDTLSTSPFTGDSCVSQTDSPSLSASPSTTPKPKTKPEAKPSPKPSASPPARVPVPGPGGEAVALDPGSGSRAAAEKNPAASPAPAVPPLPHPSGGGSLIGGVTGLVGNALDGVSPAHAQAPTPSAPPASVTPDVRSATGTVTGTAATAGRSVTRHVTAPVAKAVKRTTPTAAASPAPPTSGTPYPCPAYDAKALADATDENLPELLPNQPWILRSTLLTLRGLDYHGIVRVRTQDGTVKDVLKFTASSVDIKDLRQVVYGLNGTFQHVDGAPGSTSTMRDGTVTMYTQELRGNLFGAIPVSFTPTSPPPLNIPYAYFTDATVTQAGQFGGTLTIPGMHGYVNDSSA